MDNTITVSASPHIRSKESVSRIMLDVILALIPAAIAAVIIFGWRVLLVIVVSVMGAVITEAVIQKLMKNEGEIPQYYVKNNHEAIIEPETWDFVQTLLEHDYRKSKNSVSIFSGKLQCEDCGDWYGSKVWHSTSKYKRTIWQCNSKFKEKCQTPHFTEDEIKEVFMNAVNILMKDREQIQANFQAIETIAYSTKELEIERDKLYAEMESISNLMEQAIQNNARVALDQEKYNQEFDEMVERFNRVKEKYDAINEKIEDKKTRHIQAGRFIKTLLAEDETTTFSPLLWQSLLDYAKVSRDGKITFVFRNGVEI
jgi:site-specific DNA recombinase